MNMVGRQPKKLREMFSAEDYEVSQQLPPQGKDWNEYLLQRNVLREGVTISKEEITI